MPLADIPGGSIHYQIVGQGSTLVMLLPHSIGPAGRKSYVDPLAEHYSVITFDPRGTGGSSPAPERLSMASQAEDVIALLDSLDVDQAHLICHSTGCGVGLSLTTGFSGRVGDLILVTPWSHADSHLTSIQNLRIAVARVLEPSQYTRFNSTLLFPAEYRRKYHVEFDLLATQARSAPQDAEEIARRLGAILDFDGRPLLAGISNRTLVITATDDLLMPSWFAREITDGIKGAKLIEYESGGHMLPETRSMDIVRDVLVFFERPGN